MIYIAVLTPSNLITAAEYGAWILFAVLGLIAALLILFCRQRFSAQKQQISLLHQQLAKQQKELAKLQELEALAPELKKIAHLDHDVNTPLCVITMSMGRAQKIAKQENDEILLGNTQDILGAVSQIGEIMQAVRVLKTHPLITMKDKKIAAVAGGE